MAGWETTGSTTALFASRTWPTSMSRRPRGTIQSNGGPIILTITTSSCRQDRQASWPVATGQLACRSCLHEEVVIVKMIGPPFDCIVPRGLLLIDVGQVLLAKSAVVEPVVSHPAIDHGIHRHRHLEGRVRIHQRHQRQETIVRDTKNADLAITLRNIFYQPVDGVVSIGRVIDGSGILRTMQGTVHHILAL